MALVAKNGTPSLASETPKGANRINGLLAGEDITAGDACYINADGTVRLSNGTANNAAAVFRGMAAGNAKTGEAITVYRNVTFHYGSGLTPGASYYVAATAGRLDTATTTGGTTEVAYAVDATRIYVRG
jgi:hypothetical protein